MLAQQVLTPEDEFIEQLAGLLALRQFGAGQFRPPRLTHFVMRRGTMHMLVAATYLEQVAVGDAFKELNILPRERCLALEGGQLLIQVFDQHRSLLVRDITRRVVLDIVPLQADDVAAHGHLVVRDRHLHRGCLQRPTTLKDLSHVIAQQSEVGYLRPRVEALGHSGQSAVDALSGNAVNVRFYSRLQRCLVAQLLNGFVGGSIGQDDEVFHVFYLIFAILIISANTPAAVTAAPAP